MGTLKPGPIASSICEALAKGGEERHGRRREGLFPVLDPCGEANVQSGLSRAVNGFGAVSLCGVCAIDYYQDFETGC
jgi:hypothetical protein